MSVRTRDVAPTPLHMKVRKVGNAHRSSKFVRFNREAKRLKKKFGQDSPQLKHFLSARPGWATKVS